MFPQVQSKNCSPKYEVRIVHAVTAVELKLKQWLKLTTVSMGSVMIRMLASMVEDSYVHGIVKLNGIKLVIVASLLLE